MPNSLTDPIRANSFTLKLQGGIEAFFREASGFSSENEVIEHKQQGPKGVVQYIKQPGNLKWENITLKRGITDDQKIWEWRKQVIDGKIEQARQDGSIMGYNEEGVLQIQYDFVRGWPCKWSAAAMNADANEIILEEIEIAHEGLKRVK
ncbi:MAG TPA: phage tail protein [Chloroflexota bacterium]|nr:phage tail protein [Chloroflexota bacterium]